MTGRGGRSLVAKGFPGGHQRVETLLQGDDLEGHVTGGEDEDAHSARRRVRGEQSTQRLKIKPSARDGEGGGHCPVPVLVFRVARGNSHEQIDEEDGVQGQRR